MPIKSFVFDKGAEGDVFISDVDVILIDPKGNRKGIIATTNNAGEFEIEYPQPGYSIELSNAQYEPVVISDPSANITWAGIGMSLKEGSVGENVIVTAKRSSGKKQNYTLPVVLGSLSVITFGLWLNKIYG